MVYNSDPMMKHISQASGVRHMEFFAASLPYDNREIDREPWRRIVECAYDEPSFSEALVALDFFRACGLRTPPYTAAIEQYDDGVTNCTLYVGHVEGRQWSELNFSDSAVEEGYRVLGSNILEYFERCIDEGVAYLTDVPKLDQFIYQETPAELKGLIFVDLELHHSNGDISDQLEMFEEEFMIPLELRTGQEQHGLREKLRTLTD